MTIADINNSFGTTIAIWEKAAHNYTDADFARKPAEDSWSIGQVYQHLLSSASNFAFLNIQKCISNPENEHEQKSAAGENIYKANAFPNILIKGSPAPQNIPKQPESREAVIRDIEAIKKHFPELAAGVEKSNGSGKIKHMVLGYLDAKEWLRFVDIHFRHHLHQKERLDTFLTT